MKILIVASYNKNRFVPFVIEQAEALLQAGCEIEWFGVQGKGISGYLKAIPKLRAKIRACKPDIIHAHYGLSCLLVNLATRRIPVVSTYHGSDINLSKIRPLSKMAMRLSAWNIFVSRRTMDLVGANEGNKCSLIPCGINLPLPWEELKTQLVEQQTLNQWVKGVLEKGKKHVLFAGAFDNAVKNAELAFEGIRELENKGIRDVQLIELKGYSRNQVNALMYNCDAFLMTSKTEGSPQVVKEAMACGCPIVSVDVGDVAERTRGVEGCYIVKELGEERGREIATALEKAFAFEGKTKGREKIIADGLTNELVAKRIIGIYEDIIR